MSIELKSKLAIKARLEVLHETMQDFLVAAGASDKAKETVRKGVLVKQLLSQVSLHLLDDQGCQLAYVTLEIDWAQHKAKLSQMDGREFELDSSKSTSQQVHELFNRMQQHLRDIRKQLPVSKIEARYHYRPEIRADKDLYAKSEQYVGTVDADKLEWSPDYEVKRVMRVRANDLSELQVVLESVAKPKNMN